MRKKITYITIGFTMSGAIGLVYEVLWQRKLALIFGTTLPSVTAVLAAFMGGMALGSLLFGYIADRYRNPLRIYGILEIGIGIYCSLTPLLFRGLQEIYVYMFHRFGQSILLDVVRFLMALAILAIPCSLMGGTLPVLSRALIQYKNQVGTRLAYLYFLNTMGAVMGTLLSGFVLIRFFGLSMTNTIAVIGNLCVGVAFLFLSFRFQSNPIAEKDIDEPGNPGWIPLVYGLLGALAMAAEVAWFRALNLVIGSTVYAFTMMLAAFLLGIAIGSLIITSFLKRTESPLRLTGGLVVITGIFTIVSIAVISRLPVILLNLFPHLHQRFFVWQICLFGLGLITILPATLSMGATFPAIGKAYIQRMTALGKSVGNLYLWNTFGGILGTCAAGFILIPSVGTRMTLMIAGLLFYLTGSGILFRTLETSRLKTQVIVLALLGCSFPFVLPEWDPLILDSGVYIYAPQLKDGFESDRKFLFDKESRHSYITVTEKAGIRSLRINGKTDGSDAGDLTTQVMLAQLPLNITQSIDRVLVIGLGTGVTLGSALTHPVKSVDCIEIDEAIIEAAELFNHVSGNPFNDQRGNIVQADARTFLAVAEQAYDVIISEPSNPWISGVSNLFTLEHFQACNNHLSPEGVMCQWIHSYYMDKDVLFTLFRTFGAVFPYCQLWEGSRGDYLIIGSQYPLQDTRNILEERLSHPLISADLRRLQIFSVNDFNKLQVLGTDEYKKMIRSTGNRINTDDLPYVEFYAPQSLYMNTVESNRQAIQGFCVSATTAFPA